MPPENSQYYTLETMKNVTTTTVMITVACGVITNLYKIATGDAISQLTLRLFTLILCFLVVLVNHYQKDSLLNRGQHILLIFSIHFCYMHLLLGLV